MNVLLTVNNMRIAFIAAALIIAGCLNPALIGGMLFGAAIITAILYHQNRPSNLPACADTPDLNDGSRMDALSAMEQLGIKTDEAFDELLREGYLIRYGKQFRRADVGALALKMQFARARLRLSRENWKSMRQFHRHGLIGFESAALLLGVKPLRLLELIQSGRLREYRAGSGRFHAYKLDDVNALRTQLNRLVSVPARMPCYPLRSCRRDLLVTRDDVAEALTTGNDEVTLHVYARVRPPEQVLPTDQFTRAEVMALKARLDRIPLDQTRAYDVAEGDAEAAVASGSIPAIRSKGVILVSRSDLATLRAPAAAGC